MFNGGYRERVFERMFGSLRSRQGKVVIRSLYVTKLVAYRVAGAILNAVYRTFVREQAERTLVRLLCLKRHALNASRMRCVNDSRL